MLKGPPCLTRRMVLAAPLITSAGEALGHSYRHGDLLIGHAWCLPAEIGLTKAMMPLAVTGERPDALVGASCEVAAQVAFMVTGAGAPQPRWDIRPRRPVAMRTDGPHLALIGLKRALAVKDRVSLVLEFERNGRKSVELWVERAPYST